MQLSKKKKKAKTENRKKKTKKLYSTTPNPPTSSPASKLNGLSFFPSFFTLTSQGLAGKGLLGPCCSCCCLLCPPPPPPLPLAKAAPAPPPPPPPVVTGLALTPLTLFPCPIFKIAGRLSLFNFGDVGVARVGLSCSFAAAAELRVVVLEGFVVGVCGIVGNTATFAK
jgi:hypothetical protein